MYRRTAHKREKIAQAESVDLLDNVHEEKFEFATSRKRFVEDARTDYDQYGARAHKIYKAVEDMGRGMQRLTSEGKSLTKAYKMVAAAVNAKYGFSEKDRPLVDSILTKHWKHAGGLELGDKQPARSNAAELAPAAV